MASIYHRDGTRFLWGKWSDNTGNEQRGSLETADEGEARARVEELERLARGEDAPAAASGELTVQGFARDEWLKLRKVAKPLAWRDDLSRLTHHFFPTFGMKPLRWLETDDGARAIFAWGIGLKTHKAKRDSKPLAGRTVWNVFSVVKVLLDDAVELKRLKVNPLATFRTDKYLPAKNDKADGWRESAGFDLEQVIALCTSPRLRPHRRVWNTLAFIVGGGRTGELANLRWNNWTESHKGGLGRMVIATSYNTRAKAEKDTKTGARKLIPVHPFAASILGDWHDRGWREWMGRDPKPEDFIVPRSDFRQWGNGLLLRHFHADLAALKLTMQRQYENRSTFRNLLLRAGAAEFHVNLMTHPKPGQASDYYTRLDMQWPAMCEAILKLRLPEVTGKVTAHGKGKKKAPANEGLSKEQVGGVYGTRRRGSEGHGAAALRLVEAGAVADPVAEYRGVSGQLPAVTPDLFIEAAAVAAQREPGAGAGYLRRGLAQAEAAVDTAIFRTPIS